MLFQPGDTSGALLCEHLLRDHPVSSAVLARGYEIPEMVYPYGAPGMRYKTPGDRVPWNLSIAMPRLSDDPDAHFDGLIETVRNQPDQSLGAHYRHAFDWLTAQLGRTAWVERSARSIEYAAELDTCFPEARSVHLHRDGRECALSMREYAGLRVAVALMFGLIGEVDFTYEGLTAMVENEPERIDELLEKRPPVELYGEYWASQAGTGLRA